MTSVQRDTGLGWTTLHRIKRGDALTDYRKARILSDYTHGAVTIAELCEPGHSKKMPAGARRAECES